MIVVDCAAVVDALTTVAGTDALRARMAGDELHAPHLIDYEVVSVLRGLVRGGHLTEPRALDALTDFHDLAVQRWPASDSLRRRAFQLRHNLSAYDADYVALAEALECPLLTRDTRISRASGHAARVEVR
jgi:predicted nucleic acid-binding protein